jgi:hypothetical protein
MAAPIRSARRIFAQASPNRSKFYYKTSWREPDTHRSEKVRPGNLQLSRSRESVFCRDDGPVGLYPRLLGGQAWPGVRAPPALGLTAWAALYGHVETTRQN